MCERCTSSEETQAVHSDSDTPKLFGFEGLEAEETADVARCPVCEDRMADCSCWTCSECDERYADGEGQQCSECHACENCCDTCWTCNGCDRRRSEDYSQCSCCEQCERCCDCWYCNGCRETRSQDTYRCSNCEQCTDGCCECSYCDSCGENVSRLCRNCDVCSGCCDGGCLRSVAVHDYRYKPEARYFHESDEPIAQSRFYGIELEVNGDSELAEDVQSALSSHAYLKEDGSLDSGFEIVTHPHTFRSMRKLWSDYFADPVKGLSSYKSGECGLHIHIQRSSLTESQIRRMVVFMNAPENTAFIERVAQRSSNHYSQIKHKTLVTALDCADRYEALNLQNRKTVELRIFRGSYRLDRVLKALDFADALVEFTHERSYRELTVDDFTAYLKTNRKRYKWLWAYLTGEPVPANHKPTENIQPVAVERGEA